MENCRLASFWTTNRQAATSELLIRPPTKGLLLVDRILRQGTERQIECRFQTGDAQVCYRVAKFLLPAETIGILLPWTRLGNCNDPRYHCVYFLAVRVIQDFLGIRLLRTSVR